ncbi:MAG: DNA repair protein RecN [Neisseriaceae bacterium]
MLSRLKIVNFLLISELELDFNSGLTVVTGETGSGKSIIIDALMIVFGIKVTNEVIRPNQAQAIFEAEFNLENKSALLWLQENDLSDTDNPTNLLCKRVLDRNGKNRIYINGNVVTISQIKQIGDLILDVHTQHAPITLLKQDIQRNLLDEYAHISDKVEQIGFLFKSISKVEDKIELLLSKHREDELRKNEFQRIYDDISELALKDGEWSELELCHKQLSNAQFILQELDFINNTLNGDGSSVKSIINKLIGRIENLEGISSKYANLLKLLQTVDIEIHEAIHEVNHLANSTEHDSEKLSDIEARINAIFNISRKYRVNPENLLDYYKEVEDTLSNINQSNELDTLNKELLIMNGKYNKLANIITDKRTRAAIGLSEKITQLLHKLAIKGEFKIELISKGSKSSFGVENVEYKVCFNKGLELQSLAKAASGGELSRTALALYLILSTNNPPEIIIFDEVDIGIGGRVAAIVGKMLQELGYTKQVICITHQPQTASFGDNHFVVSKIIENDNVKLTVNKVSNEDRVQEIARMLSGIEVTDATIRHAKELLYQPHKLA